MAELSPMMQQYLEIKKQHKDEILFYRIGDFYEMFFDDALTVSRELDLTLTGKQCGLEERAPMCGVPFHSYEGYVARLISKGYKVAICEQMEDPAKAKGLVKRDIIRVVTPGTVIESSMLQDDKNNYIASIFLKGGAAGLCFADVSTGTAHITELKREKIAPAVIAELCRYHPSEVLMNPGLLDCREITAYIKKNMDCAVELVEEERYAPGLVAISLENQFGRDWAAKTGIAEDGLVRLAMAALLEYLHDTQIKGVERLKTVITYNEAQFMSLSPVTRANLELTETMRAKEKRGSLLWVLDKTKTAMGGRLLRAWMERPLLSPAQITRRLTAVEELVKKTIDREELILSLREITDFERAMTRIMTGTASCRDLAALSQGAASLPAVKERLSGMRAPYLQTLFEQLDTLADLKEKIDATIVDDPPFLLREGGLIRDGANKELDELRAVQSGGKGMLTQIEAREKEKTGIRNLRVGYNRVFGYYIEVAKGQLNLVPDSYIRKQTLSTGERYITEELKELESTILTAKDRIVALEYDLFVALRQFVAGESARVKQTAQAVAQLDVLCSFAAVAVHNHYCKPEVDLGNAVSITAGRHPVVEQMLKNALFVPNDTLLGSEDCRTAIITGPNMAGKSTYMRQVALIVLMAQMGSFVPAQSAHIGIVDRLFTRIGASDDLASGQSTFMVEMTEVADILKNATPRSLLILDEIGRGTSTFDGMAIARAVLEYAADRKRLGAKTLFATHYHELTDIEQALPGVKNFNIAVKKRQGDMIFLRKIVPGAADDSYGIEVAKLAGIPDRVITRAREILKDLESGAPERAKPATAPVSDQVSMLDMQSDELRRALEAITVETLTPIEALNQLYQLKQLL